MATGVVAVYGREGKTMTARERQYSTVQPFFQEEQKNLLTCSWYSSTGTSLSGVGPNCLLTAEYLDTSTIGRCSHHGKRAGI